MKILLDWEKIRDPRGYWKFEGYDDNKKVVDIIPGSSYNKKWRVTILDRVPWHAPTIKIAKSNAEVIYVATGKQRIEGD